MIRRPPRSTLFPSRRSSDLRRSRSKTGCAAPSSISAGSRRREQDRKSTRLNSSHANISYAVFCLKKKKKHINKHSPQRTHKDTNTQTKKNTKNKKSTKYNSR